MKNLIYLWVVALLGLATVSCDPLEDINEDLEANAPEFNNDKIAVPYTLTDEDYSDLQLDDNYFNNEDEARALMPALLEQRFPILGEGSLVEVTFMVDDTLFPVEYTVTAGDYAEAGLDFDYFSGLSDIQDFLGAKFSQSVEGDYVTLTYNITSEEIAYELTPEDYDFIGEELATDYPGPAGNAAQFSSFDVRQTSGNYWSPEMIVEAIGIVITENFGETNGQVYNVTYAAFSGSVSDDSKVVQFDGNTYVEVGVTNYELSRSDYNAIGAEFATTYPGPAGNAAQFGSFDIRETSNNYWSPAMILEAMNFILDQEFPSAADGAKFNLTYLVFSGSVTSNSLSVVNESGSYVLDTEVPTITETKTYALTEGEWNEPIILDPSVYTDEFGLEFTNFDDLEEAGNYISTYLNQLFVYAQPGDFKAVAFTYTYRLDGGNGARVFVTKYGNFRFENGSFEYLPEVRESTLQFGKVDGEWEPDNTIVYVLAASDYDYVAEELASKYPEETSNLSNFGNFNTFSWDTDTELLEAFNLILNDLVAPNAEVGQKYQLVVSIYNGSTVNANYALIKTEDGSWIYQD